MVFRNTYYFRVLCQSWSKKTFTWKIKQGTNNNSIILVGIITVSGLFRSIDHKPFRVYSYNMQNMSPQPTCEIPGKSCRPVSPNYIQGSLSSRWCKRYYVYKIPAAEKWTIEITIIQFNMICCSMYILSLSLSLSYW